MTRRLEHAFELIIQADAIETRIQAAARAGQQLGTASCQEPVWLVPGITMVVGWPASFRVSV